MFMKYAESALGGGIFVLIEKPKTTKLLCYTIKTVAFIYEYHILKIDSILIAVL